VTASMAVVPSPPGVGVWWCAGRDHHFGRRGPANQ
jgi:hypothetical protein